MATAVLEHINYTVEDPQRHAELLCRLFDWHIRWSGSAIHEGQSVHVGSDTSYIALYRHADSESTTTRSYDRFGGLNHLGIVVDDLDVTEKRVIAEGLEPHSHADYEPGRRFYFLTTDGVEVEVVSYATRE